MDRGDAIRKVLPALARNDETSGLDHIPKLFLAGEALDALDEVLVAVPVAGDQLADEGDGAEAPLLVDLVEDRVVDLAELEAGEDAAGAEDAEGLAQGAVLVGEVADAEGDRVQVDAVVWDHVEVLGVGLDEG